MRRVLAGKRASRMARGCAGLRGCASRDGLEEALEPFPAGPWFWPRFWLWRRPEGSALSAGDGIERLQADPNGCLTAMQACRDKKTAGPRFVLDPAVLVPASD